MARLFRRIFKVHCYFRLVTAKCDKNFCNRIVAQRQMKGDRAILLIVIKEPQLDDFEKIITCSNINDTSLVLDLRKEIL